MTMGEKLKDMRTKRGMTSKQVCDEIKDKLKYNISVGKYNEMEMDADKDFGYRSIVYLAKFFDVSADYLMGISEDPCTVEDIKPIIKYTGLSCDALEFVKSNSDMINTLIKTDYPQQILSNLKEISELSREQRYTEDWWGKYDIPSLEDDGILKTVEYSNIDSLVGKALMKDMQYESNGDAYACIAILQEKKELLEYSTQKIIFKLFDFISNNNNDDNEYFQNRYLSAYNIVLKEISEETEFYEEAKKEKKHYDKERLKDISNKIASMKEWLSLFETEALNNGKHNTKKE